MELLVLVLLLVLLVPVVLVATALASAMVLPRRTRLPQPNDDRCSVCGYSRHGLDLDTRCPECGTRPDRSAPEIERSAATVIFVAALPLLLMCLVFVPGWVWPWSVQAERIIAGASIALAPIALGSSLAVAWLLRPRGERTAPLWPVLAIKCPAWVVQPLAAGWYLAGLPPSAYPFGNLEITASLWIGMPTVGAFASLIGAGVVLCGMTRRALHHGPAGG